MPSSLAPPPTDLASSTAPAPIQSRPLGLFYYDPTLDKVARIGLVQSGQAVIYPPNMVVYLDVIPGLADLMVVWTKGGCEDSLVIKRALPSPQSLGLTSSARLQFWSVFQCPEPKEQRPVLLRSGLTDHIIIFDSCWLPVGCVFTFGGAPLPPAGKAAEIHLTDPSDPKSVCLAKSLVTISGQKILIAEVNYADVIPTLQTLPQASFYPKNDRPVEFANRGALLTAPQTKKSSARSIQLASTPYRASGLVLDPPIMLSGGADHFTFSGSTTYYIQSSYLVGPGMATFMNSACIKFDPGAHLLVYGAVSFPSYGQPVIFTSKDDNSYGLQIGTSTAQPGYTASQELWMYYQANYTLVQNALFRWAQRGIQYDQNPNVHNTPLLGSCAFQNCNIGVYQNMPGDTLALSADTYCNVLTTVYSYAGGISSYMTPDCGVVSVAVGGPNGTIYLLVNPSRESGTAMGFRLWSSIDKGQTFTLVNSDVPNQNSGIKSDKPMIVAAGSDLYAAGTFGDSTLWASHSADGGGHWDYTSLDVSYPSNGADITLLNGTVYVFWLQGSGSGPSSYNNKIRYAWLSGGQWSNSHDFGITLVSTYVFGSGRLLRSSNADANDFVDSNGFPRIAVANGRIYVVYADPPSAGSTDRGDIWLAEATVNIDHSLSLTTKRKVNSDGTTRDQWNPSIAASGTKIFIGYYSRQNDPNNSLIMSYGAKADMGPGLANATFDCFPISPTAFPPLFAGTSQPALGGWAYDPVWPQTGVCLDTSARYAGVGTPDTCSNIGTDDTYVNFCADDYTWAAADSSFFYFAWCDRSAVFGSPPNTRPDANVKFAKIKQ
jgi:hypothetical protein